MWCFLSLSTTQEPTSGCDHGQTQLQSYVFFKINFLTKNLLRSLLRLVSLRVDDVIGNSRKLWIRTTSSIRCLSWNAAVVCCCKNLRLTWLSRLCSSDLFTLLHHKPRWVNSNSSDTHLLTGPLTQSYNVKWTLSWFFLCKTLSLVDHCLFWKKFDAVFSQ